LLTFLDRHLSTSTKWSIDNERINLKWKASLREISYLKGISWAIENVLNLRAMLLFFTVWVVSTPFTFRIQFLFLLPLLLALWNISFCFILWWKGNWFFYLSVPIFQPPSFLEPLPLLLALLPFPLAALSSQHKVNIPSVAGWEERKWLTWSTCKAKRRNHFNTSLEGHHGKWKGLFFLLFTLNNWILHITFTWNGRVSKTVGFGPRYSSSSSTIFWIKI